jgi:hypothetical protein
MAAVTCLIAVGPMLVAVNLAVELDPMFTVP